MMHSVRRYHGVLVALHWLMAVLVGLALVMGSTVLANTPNGDPAKLDALRGHMVVGLVMGGLLVLRLITRRVTLHPPAATTGMAWADRLAPAAHWVLYGGIALMVVSGVGMAVAFDLPAVVFGGQGVLPSDFHVSPARGVHGIVAKLLMATVLLHVAAVVYHQWIRHDGLLSRMGWGSRRNTP